MSDQNYTTSFTVDQSPEEVYSAIVDPRRWWATDIEGVTDEEGAVFYYHHEDLHHCTIKVSELVPGKKVVWQILNNHFSFMQDEEDKKEWTGTTVVFDIAQKDGKTELVLTHIGLTPAYECYKICSDGWGTYIRGSLKNLITTGKGQPYEGEARTESEAKLATGEKL